MKQKEYRKKYPIKLKARNKVRSNKLRSLTCSWCNSNIKLHFHHTDYIKNTGFTLCKPCHNSIHRGVMLG